MRSDQKITIIYALLIGTGLFDIWTTIRTNIAFESSPIFLLGKSILLLFIIKLILLSLIGYFMYKVYENKKTKNILKFALILCAVYLIVLQTLAGISNIKTNKIIEANPDLQPPEPQEQVKTFFTLSLLIYYIPVFLSLIAFSLYEWIYVSQDLNKKKTKKRYRR